MTELKDLVGLRRLDCAPNMEIRHPFDADANGVCFMLDGVDYLAFEDPSDGYRSALGALIVLEGYIGQSQKRQYVHEQVNCVHRTVNPNHPDDEDDVLEIRNSVTGHLILEIGTEAVDDYYPSFVCRYYPEHLSANME